MNQSMIGIVILNYNTWDLSIKCIKSIKNHTDDLSIRIYLVDNCSTHVPTSSELAFIRENGVFIKAPKNNGYSAGNNLGLKRAIDDNCDYVMIVNTDVEFCDDSIKVMKLFLENNDAGIVGPQIYNKENEFMPIYMVNKLTAIGKIKNIFLKTPVRIFFREFERKFICKNELEAPLHVFSVSGCCFMIDKYCAQNIYPLDEKTFLYEEEYILGIILEKKDIKAFVIPNTHVIHAHGKSTEQNPLRSYQYFIESEQYYLKEYLHSGMICRYIIYSIRMIVKFFRLLRL
ncbi:Glycosyltransferase, GT2 family [Selenomonas sp. WCT3]|uniref:glycosyltransferase n=1 Tax=Selenomonas sp. WCT3 TaxID=3158785 RepID=UPI000883A245|nr:Glycosyltransferase, GT2 family [Selenomonas ruminantium]